MRALVRETASAVDTGGEATAKGYAERLRAALAGRGLAAGCHVGRSDMGAEATLEWYAGQFVEIVDSDSWFAMNAWLNCRDKFAPECADVEAA